MPGLLDPSGNLDMTAIQGLLTQFKPSAADQADARRQAILMAGLGLLGTRRGQEGEAIGRAGMLGLTTREQLLRNAQEQQQHGIQSAAQLMQLQSAAQQMADAQKARQIMAGMPLLGGPQQTPGPPQPFPAAGGGSATALMNAGAGGPPGAPATMLPTQQASAPSASISKKQVSDYYAALAMQFSRSGLPAQAKDALEMAVKNQPEVQQSKIVTDPATNKRMEMVLFKDGSTQILPYGPDLEKAHFLDTGSQVAAVDPFTGKPVAGGGIYNKTMTPGEIASNALGRANLGLSQQRLTWEQQQGEKPVLQQTDQGLVAVNPRTATAQPIRDANGALIGQPVKPLEVATQKQAGVVNSAIDANNRLTKLEAEGMTGSAMLETMTSGEHANFASRFIARGVDPKIEDYTQAKEQLITTLGSALYPSRGAMTPDMRAQIDRTFFRQAGESDKAARDKANARRSVLENVARPLETQPNVQVTPRAVIREGWSIRRKD